MNSDFITTLKKASVNDLYDISLESSNAKSKEVFIFEIGSLSNFFSKEQSEILRNNFLKNNIKVKQITNISTLPKFTENDEFINEVMSFRYVPKDIFSIENEILIFDDTVAIYSANELLVIRNPVFSKNQKQLFLSVWEEGQSPSLGFDYVPNHSFYNNLNFFINGVQVIVWPDADAKKSYGGMDEKAIESYLADIINSDPYYSDAAYIIAFIWNMNGDRMVDMWKFNNNHIDDRSGPLGDVRVYREGKVCNDLGLASGNTLLVLGYEEKLRRQSKDLKSYLDGPVPVLPLEIVNGKDFFE